jgi:hypothetical protein
LLRDVKSFIESNKEFLPIVERLTEGEEALRLTKKEHLATLFDIDNEAEKVRLGNRLVAVLGEGFRAAPVWEEETVNVLERLYSAVKKQFVQLDSNDDVMPGYEQVAETIREQVTKTLAAGVKKRLN